MDDQRTWTVLRIVIGGLITGGIALVSFLAREVVTDLNDRDSKIAQKIDIHTDQLGSISTAVGEIKTYLRAVTKQRDEQINGMKQIQADHENRIRVIEHSAFDHQP